MDAVSDARFVRIGSAATGPAVVAASRAALAAVAGADSRLVDDAVLPDLVLRLRESGVGATTLAASLLAGSRAARRRPSRSTRRARTLWDKVSLAGNALSRRQ